jgi:methionine synthase II (cobalamin-independent)
MGDGRRALGYDKTASGSKSFPRPSLIAHGSSPMAHRPGCIDVASHAVETPQEVAAVIRRALQFVPPDRLYPCTNCGMVPLPRAVARGKLQALGAGARIVRHELARA